MSIASGFPRPCGLVGALLLAPAAEARFVGVATEEVPVERAIRNVERRGGEVPDPDTLLQLARLHALASSRPVVTAEQTPQFGPDFVEVWWGHVPPALPWTPYTAGASDVLSVSGRAHLDQAVALYRRLLAQRPDDLLVKLGLGWCLARGGDRVGALPLLRDAANGTWAIEKDHTSAGMGGSHAAEAAGYLVDALDPVADAAEIAELKARIATIARRPRPVTPLLVGLTDRPLADLVDETAGVRFDLDGAGPARWPWPGPDAAWLVWDPAGRGDIRSGLQLFGSVTWWVFWEDGFQALGALDDDGDGRLAGPELDGLALWRDLDGDGRSTRREVQPLARHGIVSVGTDATIGPEGFLLAAEGARTTNGRTLPVWDWVPVSAGDVDPIEVSRPR